MDPAAARALFLNTLTPFVASASSSTGACQICYVDPAISPVALHCGHIVCRTCIRRMTCRSNLCPFDRSVLFQPFAQIEDEEDEQGNEAGLNFWHHWPERLGEINAELAAAEQAGAARTLPQALPADLRTIRARDFLARHLLVAIRRIGILTHQGQFWTETFHGRMLTNLTANLRGVTEATITWLIGRECDMGGHLAGPTRVRRVYLMPFFMLLARLLATTWTLTRYAALPALTPQEVADWEHVASLVWNAIRQLEAEGFDQDAASFNGEVLSRVRTAIETFEGPGGQLALQFLGFEMDVMLRQGGNPVYRRTTHMLSTLVSFMAQMAADDAAKAQDERNNAN